MAYQRGTSPYQGNYPVSTYKPTGKTPGEIYGEMFTAFGDTFNKYLKDKGEREQLDAIISRRVSNLSEDRRVELMQDKSVQKIFKNWDDGSHNIGEIRQMAGIFAGEDAADKEDLARALRENQLLVLEGQNTTWNRWSGDLSSARETFENLPPGKDVEEAYSNMSQGERAALAISGAIEGRDMSQLMQTPTAVLSKHANERSALIESLRNLELAKQRKEQISVEDVVDLERQEIIEAQHKAKLGEFPREVAEANQAIWTNSAKNAGKNPVTGKLYTGPEFYAKVMHEFDEVQRLIKTGQLDRNRFSNVIELQKQVEELSDMKIIKVQRTNETISANEYRRRHEEDDPKLYPIKGKGAEAYLTQQGMIDSRRLEAFIAAGEIKASFHTGADERAVEVDDEGDWGHLPIGEAKKQIAIKIGGVEEDLAKAEENLKKLNDGTWSGPRGIGTPLTPAERASVADALSRGLYDFLPGEGKRVGQGVRAIVGKALKGEAGRVIANIGALLGDKPYPAIAAQSLGIGRKSTVDFDELSAKQIENARTNARIAIEAHKGLLEKLKADQKKLEGVIPPKAEPIPPLPPPAEPQVTPPAVTPPAVTTPPVTPPPVTPPKPVTPKPAGPTPAEPTEEELKRIKEAPGLPSGSTRLSGVKEEVYVTPDGRLLDSNGYPVTGAQPEGKPTLKELFDQNLMPKKEDPEEPRLPPLPAQLEKLMGEMEVWVEENYTWDDVLEFMEQPGQLQTFRERFGFHWNEADALDYWKSAGGTINPSPKK